MLTANEFNNHEDGFICPVCEQSTAEDIEEKSNVISTDTRYVCKNPKCKATWTIRAVYLVLEDSIQKDGKKILLPKEK